MYRTPRVRLWLALFTLCSLLCTALPARADALQDAMNAAVPYGIAHADGGEGLTVYQSASTRSRAGTLADYQLCAILATTTSGKTTWYRIRYVSGGQLKEGYIQAAGFYQLTLSGLVSVMNDSASASVITRLAQSANAYQFVAQTQQAAAQATATPRPTATARARTTATPVTRKRYVLNTKTMKFHLPGCSEIDRIADENKKTTVTTRESLIEQGYTACQKCLP